MTSFQWLIFVGSPSTDRCQLSSWGIVVGVPRPPFRVADAIPEYVVAVMSGCPMAFCWPPGGPSPPSSFSDHCCVITWGGTDAARSR